MLIQPKRGGGWIDCNQLHCATVEGDKQYKILINSVKLVNRF